MSLDQFGWSEQVGMVDRMRGQTFRPLATAPLRLLRDRLLPPARPDGAPSRAPLREWVNTTASCFPDTG